MSEKLKHIKKIIADFFARENIEKPILILVLFFAAVSVTTKFFMDDSGRYKTAIYSVIYPEDWVFDDSEFNKIILTSKEVNEFTGEPVATIKLYTRELPRAQWIEDEFPLILADIQRKGYKVIDHGEMKLSENLSKWILFTDQKRRILTLHIYTIDAFNNFIQLEYSSTRERFPTYRPAFEKMKNSILLRKPLLEL